MEIKYYPTHTDKTLSEYVDLLQIPDEELNNALILDIGSGVHQRFAREVNGQMRSSKVLSIDPNLGLSEKEDILNFEPEYSIKTRRRNSESGTLAADANDIPLKTGSVDRIYALYSLPWLSINGEEKTFFKEMIRVLKTGGIIRVYPILESQRSEVESTIELFPRLKARISQSGKDNAYLLLATKL